MFFITGDHFKHNIGLIWIYFEFIILIILNLLIVSISGCLKRREIIQALQEFSELTHSSLKSFNYYNINV